MVASGNYVVFNIVHSRQSIIKLSNNYKLQAYGQNLIFSAMANFFSHEATFSLSTEIVNNTREGIVIFAAQKRERY